MLYCASSRRFSAAAELRLIAGRCKTRLAPLALGKPFEVTSPVCFTPPRRRHARAYAAIARADGCLRWRRCRARYHICLRGNARSEIRRDMPPTRLMIRLFRLPPIAAARLTGRPISPIPAFSRTTPSILCHQPPISLADARIPRYLMANARSPILAHSYADTPAPPRDRVAKRSRELF